MTRDSSNISIIDSEEARDAAVEAFKRAYLTPAIRQAMATFGMSEAEYTARLKAYLFPAPILLITTGTHDIAWGAGATRDSTTRGVRP